MASRVTTLQSTFKMSILLVFIICTMKVHCLDRTLISGSNGSDVVRAVISKIISSNISFSNGEGITDAGAVAPFMRTMAYVETRDGREHNGGGIWNISEDVFNDIRYAQIGAYDNIIMELKQDDIHNHIGPIDWNTIIYENLSIPLYSGLAVRIRMHLNPYSQTDMVYSEEYWSDVFKSGRGDTTRWETDLTNLTSTEAEECTVDTDLVFVLDESGSITIANFQKVKAFVYNFSRVLLTDTSNHSRIGLITFNATTTEHIALNSGIGSSMLLRTIDELPYYGGGTNTSDALELLRQQSWRDDISVLRLAIVLTDGMSNYPRETVLAAQSVRSHIPQIEVYTIGVGNNINDTELRDVIASAPATYSHLNSFSHVLFDSVRASHSYQICFTASQDIHLSDSADGSLERGAVARLRYITPVVQGMTFRLCIRNGRIVLYASTIPNPSRVQYMWLEEVEANAHPINCITQLFELTGVSNRRRRRRQLASDSATRILYITLEGQEDVNKFSFNSSAGKYTFDTNECEVGAPCDPNAKCINTDGSFDCVCYTGFTGNGTLCSALPVAVKSNRADIIIATTVTLFLIAIGVTFVLLIILTIVRYHGNKIRSKEDKKYEEPDHEGLLEVDEGLFSTHGPARFVPTMVDKFEGMARAETGQTDGPGQQSENIKT